VFANIKDVTGRETFRKTRLGGGLGDRPRVQLLENHSPRDID